jgi:hypothetical protein
MRPEEAQVGKRVRVSHKQSILERRGMVGRVVGCYGGVEYVAVDVRFADGVIGCSGQRIWRRSPPHRLLHGGGPWSRRRR